jgi:hypothetical protein
MSDHALSSACKDAFVVLNGAVEIKYRDGDIWRPEEPGAEHPIVPRLRAASLTALLTDPPTDDELAMSDEPLGPQLREERRTNEALRAFVRRVEEICTVAGLPKNECTGPEVLTWLKTRLGVTV